MTFRAQLQKLKVGQHTTKTISVKLDGGEFQEQRVKLHSNVQGSISQSGIDRQSVTTHFHHSINDSQMFLHITVTKIF